MSNPQITAESIDLIETELLQPYLKNAKTHPDSQIDLLVNSIKEWGFTIPILIDEHGEILAGHGRLYAALKIGLEKVPCITAKGWSAEKKKAYVIADNKLAEKGEWDNGLLFSELKAISQTSFNLDLTGMDEEFNLMNFTPDVNPNTIFSDITEDDLKSASYTLDNTISRTNDDTSLKATTVICPHCGESFRFEGM